jgi:hypothetical protein
MKNPLKNPLAAAAFISTGVAKGVQWFDQVATTDNLPDNPQ